MKNFISKNLGYIILAMMLIGIFGIGLGLDWAQSQIPWRANASTGVGITGWSLFAGSIVLLLTNTRSGG